MSIVKIESALVQHLNTLTPALPTAKEGVLFDPPTTMYQRLQFRINKPVDPVLRTGYHRESLEMQIFVNAPSNQGTGAALARAEVLRQHFKKGTYLENDGIRIYVLGTPHIQGITTIAGRTICPLLVDVTAEVLST